MAELELHKVVPVESLAVVAGSAAIAAPGAGGNAVAGHRNKPAHDAPNCWAGALEDAERLLKYAAERGIDVDDDTRNSILQARSTIGTGWDDKTAARVLAALTKLAAQLKPVTAETLRSFSTGPTVRIYWIVSICLAVCIVPFSIASFVSSAISRSITADIGTTNDLVRELNAEIGSPASQAPANTPPPASGTGGAAYPVVPGFVPGVTATDVNTKLQTLASAVRDIHDRAGQLDTFVFRAIKDQNPSGPGTRSYYQLPVPLVPAQLAATSADWIRKYQDARSFGQDVVGEVSVFYGAISYCILPVLYALLGTCAYLLRSFAQEMSNRTFVPSHSNSPRFLIAGIGGTVVGLFNNFTITQTPSISPLAIAFLVGYAVDVFFSFLEGLTTTFTKSKTGNPA